MGEDMASPPAPIKGSGSASLIEGENQTSPNSAMQGEHRLSFPRAGLSASTPASHVAKKPITSPGSFQDPG